MSGALIFTGLTAVGNGFFIKMIYDTYDVLKNTATYEYPYLQRVLRDLDLKANLQVIESLLSKVQKTELIKLEKQLKIETLDDMSRSIDDTMVQNYTNQENIDYYEELNKQIEQISEIQRMNETTTDPLQICFQNVNEMVNKIKWHS